MTMKSLRYKMDLIFNIRIFVEKQWEYKFKQNLIKNIFQIFCIKQVDQASNVVDFGFKKGFP